MIIIPVRPKTRVTFTSLTGTFDESIFAIYRCQPPVRGYSIWEHTCLVRLDSRTVVKFLDVGERIKRNWLCAQKPYKRQTALALSDIDRLGELWRVIPCPCPAGIARQIRSVSKKFETMSMDNIITCIRPQLDCSETFRWRIFVEVLVLLSESFEFLKKALSWGLNWSHVGIKAAIFALPSLVILHDL